MADTKDKDQDKGTSSNPEKVDAPERTGGPMSAATTTSEREAVLGKPVGTRPPLSAKAEKEVEKAVEEAMYDAYVANEAQRRVAAARAQHLSEAINTDNPYQLGEGQKPVYEVGGFLVDPDGNRIKKVSDAKEMPDAVIDRATSMKQM